MKKLFFLILAGFQVFLAQAQTPAGIRFDYRETQAGELIHPEKNSISYSEKYKGVFLVTDTLNQSASYYSVLDGHSETPGFESFNRMVHYYRTKKEKLAEYVIGASMLDDELYKSDTLEFEKNYIGMGRLRMGHHFTARQITSEEALKDYIPEILKTEYFEDTKEIMGYRCQKAKVFTQEAHYLRSHKLVKYQQKEYTVWFTEKLPNPFMEFAGLKGLPLEYTDGEKTYTAVRQSDYTEGMAFNDLFPKSRYYTESAWAEHEKSMPSEKRKTEKEKYLSTGYEEINE